MNIFKKSIFAIVSLFGLGCTTTTTVHSMTEDTAVWHDELSYGYMDPDEDKEARQALKFAKKHGGYKDYYSRFSLGNLYFIDGSSPASILAQDLGGKGGALGVIMGKNPRLVHLPDNALFAQFMAAIRPNPDKIKLETRCTIIEYLADTGEIFTKRQIAKLKQNKAQYQIEFEETRWIEENGTLVIDYYSYRIEEEYNQVVVKCQLRVDSSQQYTITCEPVPNRFTSEKTSNNPQGTESSSETK